MSRWAGALTDCADTNQNGFADVCGAGPGDIDLDGDIDHDDLLALAHVLIGTPLDPSHAANCDLDNNGLTNGLDIPPFVAAMLAP